MVVTVAQKVISQKGIMDESLQHNVEIARLA
jgi:hypothetical protein